MSKKILGIVLAVVVLAGGAFAFWQLQDDEPELEQEVAENGISQEEAAQLALVAENMAGASYVATINADTPEGSFESVLEFDGEGNYSFNAEQDGQTVQFILIGDTAYTCEGEQCFEFPSRQDDDMFNFNIDDFTYEEDELTDFAETATYLGEESCPAGTCDVWEIVDETETSRLYIDTDSNQISQATGTGDDGEFTMVFEYQDISIEAPENVQPFPELE